MAGKSGFVEYFLSTQRHEQDKYFTNAQAEPMEPLDDLKVEKKLA